MTSVNTVGTERVLKIGTTEIFPSLLMAPMAGVTTVAFRRLLAELGGVGLFYTEMLSARALRHETPAKSKLLSPHGGDRPLCLQLFASEPSQIGPAVARGKAWKPEVWDLNFGCPAPEIVKQGAGAAFLEDPRKGREMAAEMRRCVEGPLMFKIRVVEEGERFLEFGRMLAGEGADAVVVHARGVRQKLCRPARWDHIGRLVSALDIPVIGNGDVRQPEDALRMMESTGCRGAMIGRAAVERPWIFRRAARHFGAPVPPRVFERKSQVYFRLSEILQEEMGHPRDLYRLKEFTGYFSRNFRFGHQLWKKVHNSNDLDEAVERASAFFGRHEEEDALGG